MDELIQRLEKEFIGKPISVGLPNNKIDGVEISDETGRICFYNEDDGIKIQVPVIEYAQELGIEIDLSI